MLDKFFLALVFAALSSIGFVASSDGVEATELKARCTNTAEATTDVGCDLRATDAVEISSISVTLANGPKLESRYEPFNFKLRSSAWLFLIQTTSHPKDGAREVGQLIKMEGKRSYGVYSFAEQLAELAPIGSAESRLREGAGEISNRTPGGTALFASAYDALLKLSSFSADRRALVIIADGTSDRDSRDEKAVIELAKQNNILVQTIALTDRNDRDLSRKLLTLRRLSEETGGMYVDAGTERKLGQDTVAKFHDYLENGGMVTMAKTAIPADGRLNFQANLVGGSTVKLDGVEIKTGPISPAPQPTSWETVQTWAAANPILLAAGALVSFGVIGLLVATGMRRAAPPPIIGGADEPGPDTRRPGQEPAMETATVILPTNPVHDRVYGWLQFLDAQSTRVPIGSSTVRIGRHEDNDIRLPNNSVHRQHAVIHLTPDKQFVVRDLGGQNGVIVNNKRVDQAALVDGDLVEFGEVRARFFVNHDAVV